MWHQILNEAEDFIVGTVLEIQISIFKVLA